MATRWINIRVRYETYEGMKAAAERDQRSLSNWLAVTVDRVLAEEDARTTPAAPRVPVALDSEALKATIARVTAGTTGPLDAVAKRATKAHKKQRKRIRKQAKKLDEIRKAKQAAQRVAGQPETMEDPVRGIRYDRVVDESRTSAPAPDPERAVSN